MTLRRLTELTGSDSFLPRHIGLSPGDIARMLAVLGYEDLDELIDAAVPAAIRTKEPLELPPARSEAAVLEAMRSLAARNSRSISLIGQGYHGTVTPQVIQRNVLENPAWYTAYTPYQPEISQGRLQALLNFQTMVADLTALELANASLLDEATAAAEAMTMCRRLVRGDGGTFLVDAHCHPQTIEVLRTRAEPLGITIRSAELGGRDDAPVPPGALEGAFAVLVQYPGSDGEVRDVAAVAQAAHDAGAMVVVAADLLACTVLVPPGELGADVAVGSTQRFGVPMWFGGPHAAYFATRAEHERSLPGRLVGVSVDAEGRPALRLALQTREQHIRREKATSNICTAQALLACVAAFYASYHGPEGLRAIAERVHRLTVVLAHGLRAGGEEVLTERYFDTITVASGRRTDAVLDAARAQGIDLRRLDAGTIGISLDERTTPAIVEAVLRTFAAAGKGADGAGGRDEVASLDGKPEVLSPLPDCLLRTSPYLTHPVFHRYRSETELMRYIRSLSDQDLALDRAMIPLGSCTMKANSAVELAPLTWPELADAHPFAPLERNAGYLQIIGDLEAWLAEISGYDAVSLQPNAGSQGELAGLLAIRAYHAERNDAGRDVCLIPTSAHGTNAASAVMAGLRVVAVACDERGNVDLSALRGELERYAGRIAAIMLTYPSTHGVYEESVLEVCALVHDAGGEVYIDGANLNALVGLVRLAEIGGDVSHFNLHKTFCIPHGGGGPGVGPIGVRAHLAPFLPGVSRTAASGEPGAPEAAGAGPGAVAAAPYGSPGVLPVSWAYIALMGPDGLTSATRCAVLSANYLAERLSGAYPVLYRGNGGRVAHECILDIRPITEATGITAEDVAKRLIDHGFHAPTMSFPVAGTLMVEPTESESLAELDRFCEAMLAIRAEIGDIEEGLVPAGESALRHAPHTAQAVTADVWDRPYSRQRAAYPSIERAGRPGRERAAEAAARAETAARVARKYWPPVARIDNAYGDRNLVCACPPLEELAEPPV